MLLLDGHRGRVASVAFSPDGERIVTAAGFDGTVTVWNATNGERILKLDSHTGIAFAAVFSPDGLEIVTSSRKNNGSKHITVGVWDAFSGKQLRTLEEMSTGHGTSAVAYSKDGRRIAAITEQRAVKVWDAESGEELSVCRSTHELYSVALSPDGERLLTGGADETLVWHTATGKLLMNLQGGNQREVWSVAYSPDGTRIVTTGGDQRVILWDAATGKELFRLAGHRAGVNSVAFSRDGKRVVTASADGTVKVWDATGPSNPRTVQIQTESDAPMANALNMLAFSPDGTRVAATVADKTVRIRDVSTGRELLELLTLEGHTRQVTSAVFSPDGRSVATAGYDGLIKIWEAATPENVASWKKDN